eukprot:8238517-Pyramimonas_sp.AAC.1
MHHRSMQQRRYSQTEELDHIMGMLWGCSRAMWGCPGVFVGMFWGHVGRLSWDVRGRGRACEGPNFVDAENRCSHVLLLVRTQLARSDTSFGHALVDARVSGAPPYV